MLYHASDKGNHIFQWEWENAISSFLAASNVNNVPLWLMDRCIEHSVNTMALFFDESMKK